MYGRQRREGVDARDRGVTGEPSLWEALKLLDRERHDFANLGPSADKGDEAVHAERIASARRNVLQRVEELLVNRVEGEPACRSFRAIAVEARPLLDGVDELTEAVAELDPPDVELEALGDARIVGAFSSERRLRGRVVDEEHRRSSARAPAGPTPP